MANLWKNDGSGWSRQPLADDRFVLGPQSGVSTQSKSNAPLKTGAATLGNYGGGTSSSLWVLLAAVPFRVFVNGHKLSAGIHVLNDRDEILLADQSRFYFSTEEQATVEPFSAGENSVFCARCRQAIESGTPAVRCPGCGHWCEQSADKPCWTYGPNCPMCEQPTDFETGLRWTPEEL